jgi:sarcosine oxidase, subunit gamma
MTMESPIERNALSDLAPIDSAARLRVALAPDCARFSLRVRDAARGETGRALGCALPDRIGGFDQSKGRSALCVGPDEWFLLAPLAEANAIEDRFRSVQAPHSLVNVSHREIGIDINGPAAALALNSACPLDLDAITPASGTRTIFDKAPIVLIKYSTDRYRIEVWQSFASHVWGILALAGREIALAI